MNPNTEKIDEVIFQSTLLQEERRITLMENELVKIFQSTLLQEERHVFYITICISFPFNPRSYKRSDKILLIMLVHCRLSIHAPTRGATFKIHTIKIIISLSIHAPTRGATMLGE